MLRHDGILCDILERRMLGKSTGGRRRIQLVDDLLETKNYADIFAPENIVPQIRRSVRPCAHYKCIVLYCTVLYCTVLYCTVLYCMYCIAKIASICSSVKAL